MMKHYSESVWFESTRNAQNSMKNSNPYSPLGTATESLIPVSLSFPLCVINCYMSGAFWLLHNRESRNVVANFTLFIVQSEFLKIIINPFY